MDSSSKVSQSIIPTLVFPLIAQPILPWVYEGQ
jgi:hypothetical protein